MLASAILFITLVCIAGASWTVYWSWRFGLAPRPPLSALQTAARLAIVTVAVILLPFRRDWLERTALVCAIVAAASSALFGFGFRSTTLDVVRLLFHFLAYALGVVVSVRWLARLWRATSAARVEKT